MTEIKNNILVFKTNIHGDDEKQSIAPVLNNHQHILKWNIDTDDIDKVLRIETKESDPKDIIEKIKSAGFHCEELED